MIFVEWYCIVLMICVALYIVMLVADWYIAGKPNLEEMRTFLTLMLSGSVVSAIGFGAKYLVDRNHNGIPDVLEGSEEAAKNPQGDDTSAREDVSLHLQK